MNEREYKGFLQQLNAEQTERTYADNFFSALGADPLEVMDASSYEGAQLIQDLNAPIDQSLQSTYDTVIDGGTLEHVFNFPVAVRNCMELVKPGGSLVLITPWHNLSGHGLYQFSPELFYSVLSPANGSMIERMLVVADGYWYAIRNPAEIRQRIEVQSKSVIEMFIHAKRTSTRPIFESWPQQSDYQEAWKSGAHGKAGAATGSSAPSFKDKLVRRIPVLQSLQDRWREHKFRRNSIPAHHPGMVRICKNTEIPG
jgi:SAM-dependent methyltransferase